MGIDVLNVAGIDMRIFQRIQHAAPRTIHARRGDVIGVSAHAHAGELGVDAGAARLCVFQRFEHQNTGTLTQYKAIAIPVPGTRRGFRRIITFGQGFDGTEATHAGHAYRCFRTAGNHHIRVTVLNEAGGVTHAMRGSGTGRHHRYVRALESVQNGNHAGNHIDNRARHKKRRNSTRTLGNHLANIVLDHRQAADTGADVDADAFRIFFGNDQARIVHRHLGCGDAKMDERIHPPHFLGGHPVGGIESLHLTRNPRGKWCGIKPGNRPDTTATVDEVVPGCRDRVTNRRNNAEPRNDDAPFAHG